MKTDIEIAQAAEMLPIGQVAHKAGVSEELLEYYGRYKAKTTSPPCGIQGPEGQADPGHRYQSDPRPERARPPPPLGWLTR